MTPAQLFEAKNRCYTLGKQYLDAENKRGGLNFTLSVRYAYNRTLNTCLYFVEYATDFPVRHQKQQIIDLLTNRALLDNQQPYDIDKRTEKNKQDDANFKTLSKILLEEKEEGALIRQRIIDSTTNDVDAVAAKQDAKAHKNMKQRSK